MQPHQISSTTSISIIVGAMQIIITNYHMWSTESDGLLRLYYNERRNFTVPGTLYDQKGLVNITINSFQLANRKVSLTWEQHMVVNINNAGMDCDVWSLDNVEVTLQYENCTETVLSEDFEGK